MGGLGGALPPKVLLRPRLMYSDVRIYYCIMFLNPLLRLLWTFSLLPSDSDLGQWVTNLGPFLCSIELFRRCFWAVLYLEYHHIEHSERWYGASFRSLVREGREASIEQGFAQTLVSTDTVPFHFGERDIIQRSSSKSTYYVTALGSLSAAIIAVLFVVAVQLNAHA